MPVLPVPYCGLPGPPQFDGRNNARGPLLFRHELFQHIAAHADGFRRTVTVLSTPLESGDQAVTPRLSARGHVAVVRYPSHLSDDEVKRSVIIRGPAMWLTRIPLYHIRIGLTQEISCRLSVCLDCCPSIVSCVVNVRLESKPAPVTTAILFSSFLIIGLSICPKH
jgi:hypothetical protein